MNYALQDLKVFDIIMGVDFSLAYSPIGIEYFKAIIEQSITGKKTPKRFDDFAKKMEADLNKVFDIQ